MAVSKKSSPTCRGFVSQILNDLVADAGQIAAGWDGAGRDPNRPSGLTDQSLASAQRTTAWNETWPSTPGATVSGRTHFSSVEPTRFSSAENAVPFGPRALPFT